MKRKGVQFGGFGSQFACSWAGADSEILVPDLGGGSKPDWRSSRPLLTFYSVPIDHSKGTKISMEGVGIESKFVGAVGVW